MWPAHFLPTISGARFNGLRLRPLTIVDAFTREALAIEIDQGIRGAQILALVARLAFLRRTPCAIQVVRCLVPEFDGAIFTSEWRDALWARFFTAAPRRLRRSVERCSQLREDRHEGCHRGFATSLGLHERQAVAPVLRPCEHVLS